MTIDGRIATLLLWGGGTLIIFAIVFYKAVRRLQEKRKDRRRSVRIESRRDVIVAFALLLVAAGSATSTYLVLFGEPASGARGVAVAIALGAFTGVGLVMLTEDGEQEHDEAVRD